MSEDAYREHLMSQIVEAFHEFARHQAEQGYDETYFVGAATKGVRLLDIMLRRYNVVAANPPYMFSHNMSPVMNEYLKRHYPASKRDLYASFIDRCTELLAPGGRAAMITQQSFMFISSYEDLRARLMEKTAIEAMIHVGPHAFAEIGGEKVNTTLYVLRREPDASLRANSTGVYFRLVSEPDAEAKEYGFERSVAALRAGNATQAVYRYRQGDFAVIPSAPWVYWITPELRRLFQTLPKLGEVAELRQGLATADNFRFLRYWWEVGVGLIGFSCTDAQQALATGKRWFPHMKGGSFRRWWGNQEYAINWAEDGAELRAFTPMAVIRNPGYYFRRGVTWSRTTSKGISVRFMPSGFIFDAEAASAFSADDELLLGQLNSSVVTRLLGLINPTIHFQIGDLARLPISTTASQNIRAIAEQGIALARLGSAEDETTYEFVVPPAWPGGAEDVAARARKLAQVERQIDEEVYRLYGISTEDRQAIEAELAEVTMAEDDSSENSENEPTAEDNDVAPSDGIAPDNGAVAGRLSRQMLAARWVSYAIGIVLGRFQPGIEGALGYGHVSLEQAAALQALRVPTVVAVLDPGHEDDLVVLVEQALALLVGEAQVEPLLTAATGGRPLSEWLVRDYFKQHVQQYRRRPIYWLLQSPKKRYSLWLFHERITRDTLHLLQGNRYLGGRINRARGEVQARRERLAPMPQGAERRRLEREIDALEGDLTDLEAFAKALAAVTSQTNTRGEIVGWAPEVDDGVLINLAPLWTLLPSWSTEPKQCWQALERGDYDWSHTAMRYWPDRVLAKCQTNPSYALAHGVAAQAVASRKP